MKQVPSEKSKPRYKSAIHAVVSKNVIGNEYAGSMLGKLAGKSVLLEGVCIRNTDRTGRVQVILCGKVFPTNFFLELPSDDILRTIARVI